MNKQRRIQIEKVMALIEEARCLLEDIQADEEQSFDNLPESLQYSERGETISDNADRLMEVVEALQDQEDELFDII